MLPRILPLLVFLLLVGACAKQPSPTSHTKQPSTKSPIQPIMQERSVQALITGIEQFDDGQIMALKTARTMYVVGPKVSSNDKRLIHEVLMDNRDSLITIRYVDVPPKATTIAHKLVTAIVVEGREFLLQQ